MNVVRQRPVAEQYPSMTATVSALASTRISGMWVSREPCRKREGGPILVEWEAPTTHYAKGTAREQETEHPRLQKDALRNPQDAASLASANERKQGGRRRFGRLHPSLHPSILRTPRSPSERPVSRVTASISDTRARRSVFSVSGIPWWVHLSIATAHIASLISSFCRGVSLSMLMSCVSFRSHSRQVSVLTPIADSASAIAASVFEWSIVHSPGPSLAVQPCRKVRSCSAARRAAMTVTRPPGRRPRRAERTIQRRGEDPRSARRRQWRAQWRGSVRQALGACQCPTG